MTRRQSPRDELLSLVCVRCPLKFFLLAVPGLSGVTAQKHPVALEAPLKLATRLALQGPSQELPESRDSVAPCLWGDHLGPPPPPHTFQRPCRWVLQHLLPQGVNRLRASGSCFPRAPLGGEHPQHNRPASGSRAARPWGLLPRRLGPGRAFCLRGSRAAAWALVSARAGHCARVCVCACQRARACVHRSWGRGGGGTLLFARLFPNMAPLLRTQEKKNPVVLSK